jgi:hypothetical protein
MGVALVTGMQGDDPKYYRVISTPKHYAVHSGPGPTRHFADVDVSKHDMLDTYQPAFRATVVEGKAGSVMCAINSINGQPACANEFLLQDQLRAKWGFQGYVVSDCGAVHEICDIHRCRIQFCEGCRRLWKASNQGRSTSLPRRMPRNFSATLRRVNSGSKGSQSYGFYVNRGNCALIGREAVDYSPELLHRNPRAHEPV